MGRTKPAHRHNKNRTANHARDLRRRLKDEDVLYEEYQTQKPADIDVDLPGLGQFYCFSCGKHYKDEATRDAHFKTSLHRRLLRRLKNEKPYTVEEANAAAGLGSYTYNPKGLKPGEKTLGEKLNDAEAAKKQLEADGMMDDVQQVQVSDVKNETKME